MNNSFQPHFYMEGGVWFYFDGFVRGAVDGSVDLTQPEPVQGRDLVISEWSSNEPSQGHSKRALQWLRTHFTTIVANGVGMIDEEGPDISVMYWVHMRELGLVDILLDDEGTVITKQNMST